MKFPVAAYAARLPREQREAFALFAMGVFRGPRADVATVLRRAEQRFPLPA